MTQPDNARNSASPNLEAFYASLGVQELTQPTDDCTLDLDTLLYGTDEGFRRVQYDVGVSGGMPTKMAVGTAGFVTEIHSSRLKMAKSPTMIATMPKPTATKPTILLLFVRGRVAEC